VDRPHYTKFGNYTGQSTANFLDFRHIALFRNQSASDATVVENCNQISDFSRPSLYKSVGGLRKMSEYHFQLESRSYLWYTSGGGPLGELQDLASGWEERQQNRVPSTHVGRPNCLSNAIHGIGQI